MTSNSSSPVSWVQLMQALVARELVEQLGVPSHRAAGMLGLAPSAISQYLSGKRLAGPFLHYSTDDRARRVARQVAQTLAHEGGDPGSRNRIILEGAMELSGATLSARPESPPLGREGSARLGQSRRQIVQQLHARVRAEQAAVTACMHLAQKARDEMTRAVFRQIASDSLRHAEIVASLATYLDRGVTAAPASGVTREEVEAMIEAEQRAEEQAGEDLGKSLGGMLAILVESMEADERKHAELLQGMLARGFEEDTASGTPATPRRRSGGPSSPRPRRPNGGSVRPPRPATPTDSSPA